MEWIDRSLAELDLNGSKKSAKITFSPSLPTLPLCEPIHSLEKMTVWQILAWNPIWLKEYKSDQDLKCLPPLVDDIDMSFVNKTWEPLVRYDDYKDYKDRHRKLHLLELWQQINNDYANISGNGFKLFHSYEPNSEMQAKYKNYDVYDITRTCYFKDSLRLEGGIYIYIYRKMLCEQKSRNMKDV